MVARVFRSLACAGAVWLAPAVASAQTATALERLEPAPAGDGFFAVPRADVPGDLRTSAALVFSYADSPLSLRVGSGDAAQDAGEVVSYQLTGHVLAAIEIHRFLKFDLDVPVTLAQGGDSPSITGLVSALPPGTQVTYGSPEGAAMNDLRLGLRLVLLPQRGAIPAASLVYAVWVPTGDETAFTGTGEVRHMPSIVVGADMGRFSYSIALGRRVQDTRSGLGLLGGELVAGGAIAGRFGRFSAYGELYGSTVTVEAAPFGRGTTNIELLLGGRATLGPLSFGLAGGPGLTAGVGTPTFRLVASVGASFDVPQKAQAKAEGATNARASASAGDPKANPKGKNGSGVDAAAAPDADGDGVPDANDVCPDRAGDATPTAARPGCPPDRDGDAIADADDVCPDEPGVASADPARFGCALDTDGDGIADAVDACPKERGEVNADPKITGCPASVRVEGTQIVILQEVNFATGSDVIAPESYALLEQVGSVLAQHPEIARVAIDGHTDNVGAERANVTLSQRRAVAVVRWLVDHGVDARRLEARGFGPRRPVASNDKPEGRAKNRRVEFQILRRTPLGEAGWKEGAAK
ncbi:OmpA family protein [Polyangium jinanense]|uniref:OmpA family protein n=1 Tax=Polyangium jinanense TaxID=2829994 RepID=A0A9X4AYR9_9BACT|nr:OmpA family protein [Polyangium jinanense]MDC3959205.1 OmpA family protein [Polyangium jinanense]MDC3987575.1 OmpA family protein [Polyangium jinanense]MDC3989129.1 OmpA family protein [Polyangium jinanense]